MLGIKNLLALVGLVVVAFGVAGWYLGWYKIAEQNDAQGHPQLKIQVNAGQVEQDLEKAKHKVLDGVKKAENSVTPATGPGLNPPGFPQSPPPGYTPSQPITIPQVEFQVQPPPLPNMPQPINPGGPPMPPSTKWEISPPKQVP